MDESFDCKIRKLLEEGKKLGFNPKKPEEIIEDDNSNMQGFYISLKSFYFKFISVIRRTF